MSKLNVLYVDDDRDLRDVASMSLELDPDIQVCVAESGAAALDMLDRDAFLPDVVLLDVMMPGMDGPEVLAQLRDRPRHALTPVIFITARTQTRESQAYRQLDVLGLISKPFDPLTLAKTVRDILARAAP